MTLRYADVPQVVAQYSSLLRDVSSQALWDTYIPDASQIVSEELAMAYSIPFSSNNATARSLTIHQTALLFLLRTRKQDDSPELGDWLSDRFESLRAGSSLMLTDSGEVIAQSGGTAQAWSPVMDKKPVFDMRDAQDQRVDPDLLREERDRDLEGV